MTADGTSRTVRSTGAAAPAPTPDSTARRIEELLDGLGGTGGPAVAQAAEELVRTLMDLYGAGLARVVALLSGRTGNPLGPLLDDQTVAGLLVLHALHPDSLDGRIDRALRAAEAAGEVDAAGFDAATGRLRLRRTAATGCGCGGGSADAVRERVEAALGCFAPEVAAVDWEEDRSAAEPVLLQIGTRPPGRRDRAEAR
jgi:hypothetical protein